MGNRIKALAVTCAASGLLAAPASAAWEPEPARFGVGEDRNVPVELADGTTVYADVYFPTDEATGAAADGEFPVALMITPYGKRAAAAVGASSGEKEGENGLFKPLPILVRRGYINVIAEIRGTGRSEGSFELLDPQQGRDGAELVRWASRLPNANGEVGMYGPSYMGIIQLFTAGELGRHSPLEAVLPVVTPNDPYRELFTSGGIIAGEANVPLLAVFIALPLVEPFLDEDVDPGASAESVSGRPQSLLQSLLPLAAEVMTNGDRAYDEAWWDERAPAARLRRLVRSRVPALFVGGWFDVFQRGALMNLAATQNLSAGRPQAAPMRKRQPITSRYQALVGPWSHIVAGEGFALERMALRWFDTWLRDRRTGLERVRNPVHVFDLGRDRWIDRRHYPLVEAPATTLYLREGRALSAAAPSGEEGADSVSWSGFSSPCSLTTEQYSLGAAAILLGAEGNPCLQDDTTVQAGPGALAYTSEPFAEATTLAGPIDATIYATSTRPEVQLVATVEDVAPGGGSRPLSSGALLGSFRALDEELSWLDDGGRPILPHHPYTRASVAPVPTGGEVSRFDIEIPPTVATLEPGHRLRITITTSDSPHLMPTPAQLAQLAGGIYGVQRNAAAASFVNVPLAPADDLSTPCRVCEGHVPAS